MPENRVQVGDTLYGFCGGAFGRDSYEDKRVEAVGKDWIVCRDNQGQVHFADLSEWTIDQLAEYTKPQEDEDGRQWG